MSGERKRVKEREILERLHQEHLEGSALAARQALLACASLQMPMPRWLSEIVIKSIEKSSTGNANNALGFGNPEMLDVWEAEFLNRRNSSIRSEVENAQMLDKLHLTGEKKGSGWKEDNRRNPRGLKFDDFPPETPNSEKLQPRTKGQIIETVAKKHNLDVKTAEKHVYRKRK